MYDVNDNVSQGRSFGYKTKITGKTPAQPPRSPGLSQIRWNTTQNQYKHQCQPHA